ncbi:hypothetical protein FRC14_005393 [Serendipita sp. 396]|nr:hypothetical protein FRC14_005393 [Serendipita sp. 396]KAG8779929.1 hypothetical protein FRC15_009845 [Serendipita sp. 397]KAG8831119.1 hypothetical protein FRC18_007110 [Serendipita sp. 400]KAG8865535.1 hypothetical protein FRC20_009712 [Serendipita sp. 405]KAG9053244.1 hypothetical protein FS842_008463 [Serendipita sp. 407]
MSLITPSPKASTSFPLPPPIPPEKKKRKPPAPRYSPRDPNARHGALDPNRTRGQFICEHPGCGKDFTRSDNFKRHQKCHEVYLEWTCPFCLKKCSRTSNAGEHLEKVHNVHGLCPNCSAQLTRPNLVRHLTDPASSCHPSRWLTFAGNYVYAGQEESESV